MPRFIERIYPYVIAICGAAAFWHWKRKFPEGQDILSASITLGAVFAGFLATLNSMVIGLQGSKMRRFKNTKFFLLLLQYIKEAVWASLVFCALCLLGFYYDPKLPPDWFGTAWVFCGVTTLLAFGRVSSVLINLIKSAD